MARIASAAAVGASLLLLHVISHAYAAPVQYLADIPGYIPVYIRLGDQPLAEINPLLAEAFHEPAGIVKASREVRFDEPKTESPKDINDVSLDSIESDATVPPRELDSTLPDTTTEMPEKTTKPEKESFVMKIPRSSRKMTRESREQKLEK